MVKKLESEKLDNMKKCNKKFVFTNALYNFLIVYFAFMVFKISMFATIEYNKLGTILYENGAWDVLNTIGLLIVILSFKEEKKEE